MLSKALQGGSEKVSFQMQGFLHVTRWYSCRSVLCAFADERRCTSSGNVEEALAKKPELAVLFCMIPDETSEVLYNSKPILRPLSFYSIWDS